MNEKAYAKINISLNVAGTRPDGYHLLDTIMVPVDLADTIDIELAEATTFSCTGADLAWNSENNVYRTLELMKRTFGLDTGFAVKMTCRIPQCAGLGGSSADAAATLRLVDRLCRLHCGPDQLARLGVRIGADVPFCVYQTPSRVKGIGEYVTPIAVQNDYDVILVKPRDGVNTGQAFKLSDTLDNPHPDLQRVQEALEQGKDLAGLLGNSLQPAAQQLVPEIRTIQQEFRAAGYRQTAMTGSGSAVFALVEPGRNDEAFLDRMRQRHEFVLKTAMRRGV